MNISPHLGITLPVVIAIVGAAWLQIRRIDALEVSLNKRFDDVDKRIDEIDLVLREMQASLKDLNRRDRTRSSADKFIPSPQPAP